MIGKNTISKVVTALVLGGMVIASSSMAYAQSTSSTKNYKLSTNAQHFNGPMKGAARANTKNFKTLLDGLVTAGTITSDQETAVLKAFTPSTNGMGGDHKGGPKNQLDALVTAGTITSAQETSILSLFTNNNANTSN